MNTILLVDDDEYVIDGLMRHIPWEDMGVRVVGTARDGREGLDKFRHMRPDVVFTDIYMPEMDGFQLTDAIHAEDATVPVVILSGYDDYANARKAVSSGIQHFLLKPPSIAEIMFVVREIQQQLTESEERDQLLANYLQQQEVVRQSMRAMFFRDLLTTRYRLEQLPGRRIAFMGLPDKPEVQTLTISLIRSDASYRREEREWQLLRFGTGNIIRETLADKLADEQRTGRLLAEVVEYSDQEFVILFLGCGDPVLADGDVRCKIMHISEEIITNVLRYMKLSVLAGLGSVKRGYESLIDSYLESRQALDLAEMREWNRVFVYEDDRHGEGDDSLALETVSLLFDAIHRKQWPEVRARWDKLKEELAAVAVPLPVAKGIAAGLISVLWAAVQPDGYAARGAAGSEPATGPSGEGEGSGLETLHVQLARIGSPGQLVNWMDSHVNKLLARLREDQPGRRGHALVDRVIRDYIEKEYHQPLALEQIARELHVNRNYMSQLFKRVTGEPFVTYLNKYRIRKAIELLETGRYMVYEISDRVGFQNSTYFSQVFKSVTGYSPSAYNRH